MAGLDPAIPAFVGAGLRALTLASLAPQHDEGKMPASFPSQTSS